MWFSFAPPHPEALEYTTLKRGSVTPAQIAVLPRRECPSTATRFASSMGCASIQSRTRLWHQAHERIVPQLEPVRSFSPPYTSNRP